MIAEKMIHENDILYLLELCLIDYKTSHALKLGVNKYELIKNLKSILEQFEEHTRLAGHSDSDCVEIPLCPTLKMATQRVYAHKKW